MATTIETIQLAVAEFCGIPLEQLKHGSLERVSTIPRQIAMYLSKQLTAASLPEIGREFGNKHHTTVMHSIAKIHHLRTTDAGVNEIIERVMKRVQQSTRRLPNRD